MLRATCSADFHRCRPDSNDTKDTRVSAGSRRKHTVTRKNVCSRQNCQTRVTFDTPKPDARTTVNKDGEKHGQREILESRDIRQVPNKRRVEVQSQNRDSLIRDVCTCLAIWDWLTPATVTSTATRRMMGGRGTSGAPSRGSIGWSCRKCSIISSPPQQAVGLHAILGFYSLSLSDSDVGKDTTLLRMCTS